MPTPHITIKVPPEVKDSLDFLARITGQNVSELIRDIVIPLAQIKTTLSAIETLERQEKMLVKAIIGMPEFQQVLEKLQKFQFPVELPCEPSPSGYCLEYAVATVNIGTEKWYREKYGEIMYVSVREEEKEGKHYPVIITDEETKKVELLYELYVWLRSVTEYYRKDLEDLIEGIKENIKRLTQ